MLVEMSQVKMHQIQLFLDEHPSFILFQLLLIQSAPTPAVRQYCGHSLAEVVGSYLNFQSTIFTIVFTLFYILLLLSVFFSEFSSRWAL
jgi:hypothetical protein